jgi:hypothetical protein
MSGVKRRLKTVAGIRLVLAAFACFWVSPAPALEKTISVVIDQAHLVDLPAGTATLIIGNPTIVR